MLKISFKWDDPSSSMMRDAWQDISCTATPRKLGQWANGNKAGCPASEESTTIVVADGPAIDGGLTWPLKGQRFLVERLVARERQITCKYHKVDLFVPFFYSISFRNGACLFLSSTETKKLDEEKWTYVVLEYGELSGWAVTLYLQVCSAALARDGDTREETCQQPSHESHGKTTVN